MAEWVVLELSSKADGEDPDLIRSSIRHQIKDAEVYLPVSVTKVGGDKVINYMGKDMTRDEMISAYIRANGDRVDAEAKRQQEAEAEGADVGEDLFA